MVHSLVLTHGKRNRTSAAQGTWKLFPPNSIIRQSVMKRSYNATYNFDQADHTTTRLRNRCLDNPSQENFLWNVMETPYWRPSNLLRHDDSPFRGFRASVWKVSPVILLTSFYTQLVFASRVSTRSGGPALAGMKFNAISCTDVYWLLLQPLAGILFPRSRDNPNELKANILQH